MAKAMLDGVDGFSLGAETVKGNYFVQTLQVSRCWMGWRG